MIGDEATMKQEIDIPAESAMKPHPLELTNPLCTCTNTLAADRLESYTIKYWALTILARSKMHSKSHENPCLESASDLHPDDLLIGLH